jgi:hypothetical protein
MVLPALAVPVVIPLVETTRVGAAVEHAPRSKSEAAASK